MRILTFLQDGGHELGLLLDGERVVAVRELARLADTYLPSSMLELIDEADVFLPRLRDAVARARAAGCKVFDRDRVRITAPIPRPRKAVFGVGMNYAAHVEEAHRAIGTSRERPKAPVYFAKPPTAVIGPEEFILHHEAMTRQLDWEAELAVIIGKRGKCIPRARALEHVFGYSCINDISARDCRREHQWFLVKGQDNSAPMGPVIVTRDEIADPQNLTLSLKVNGELKQRDSTAQMIFTVADIIADLSQAITLEPGDIIATGTPSGVGVSLEPPQFLKHGDHVEMEVQGIGILKNTVCRA